MLTAKDIRGLYAIIPTPSKPGSDRIDATDTVDLAETERVINQLIKDGVNGLIVAGTTGECATMTNADYEAFVTCVLETVNHRIPTFVGTTALGAQESYRRMKLVEARGADGVLLGLPMWQPLVTASAVRYYSEFSRAFPKTSLMVYANTRAFRFAFGPDFWEAVVKEAPTVSSAKYSRPNNLLEVLKVSGGRVNFLPNETAIAKFYEISPETTTAAWSISASMGPSLALAIMNAALEGNSEAVKMLGAAIAWYSAPGKTIVSNPELFASYNIQLEKGRVREAGYTKLGPNRPPYDFVPAEIEGVSRECGRRWVALCNAYQGNYQFKQRIWEQ